MDAADDSTEEVGSVESVDLPLSVLGDQAVAEGDVVRLEVVSVDEANGVLKVRYAHPKGETETETETETTETEPEPSIEGLAKAFD